MRKSEQAAGSKGGDRARVKGILCITALIALCPRAVGQYFQQLGNGLDVQQSWGMYSDTTGLYYLGGSRGEINGVLSPGAIRWDGIGYNAMGCGFEWDCVTPFIGGLDNPVRDMVRWNGDLYACGDFTMSDYVVLNNIAKYDGNAWQPLGHGMNGPVRSLKAYPDGLYAAGWFTYADTVPANGLARWDGTRWYSVHDVPKFMFPNDSLNFINDVAIYEDEMYICGVFSGPGDLEELAKYDGTAWVPVGQGIRGSLAKVLHLDVHDSLLYISGAFADVGPFGNSQNPASGIVGWDGNDWVELGAGTDGASTPWVTGVGWRNDTLYACGDYDRIGGITAGGLAYWEGQKWCALLPGPGPHGISCLAFYQDTLHVGGGMLLVDADTAYGAAKWTYGDHVEECGIPMSVERLWSVSAILSLTPNPTTDQLTLHYPALHTGAIDVTDALGRTVMRTPWRNQPLDVRHLPPGVYQLTLRDELGIPVAAGSFVKE